MSTKPSKELQVFQNPNPDRDYTISMTCPEFTCLCPMTGQPDFAVVHLDYIPDKLCIELKSLKLYLWSYREEGAYHEAVTNQILDDLVKACSPRKIDLRIDFKVRGGIHTNVLVQYSSENEIGHRPWGKYEVLKEGKNHKIKRITVYPGKRLSLQRHQKRMEHWVMVEGEALFTLDDQEKRLTAGDTVEIPKKAVHRIQNCGETQLVFIEIQRGEYFGEDDIERLEDDYNRK